MTLTVNSISSTEYAMMDYELKEFRVFKEWKSGEKNYAITVMILTMIR